MQEKSNAAISVVLNRKSVRNFKDEGKTVSQEDLNILLKAAFAAPSAVNLQPWHFIVINERSKLNAMADKLPYAKMLSRVSVAIAVCGDKNESELYWDVDCAAATENLLLAAEALELGAVWTAVYPREERIKAVREILNLPQNIMPLCVIPIGYPSGIEKPKDKYNPKKIHINGW